MSNNLFDFTKRTFPINNRKEKEFQLIGLGYVNLSCENADDRRRTQRYYTLHFVISGKGYLEVSGKKYEISKNDIFALPDNLPFFYYPDSQDPWSYLFFEFKGTFVQSYLSNIGFSNNAPIKTCLFPEQIVYLTQEFFNKNTSINDLSYYQSVALFLTVLSSAKTTKNEPTFAENTLISNIKSFVRSRLLDLDFSVEYIAKNFYISHSYLCKLFKKETGQTLINYIIEKKMLIAENLLITTNYSITEISFMSGFHNYPHFLSTFKNLHGQTASEYRNNFIKNNKRD